MVDFNRLKQLYKSSIHIPDENVLDIIYATIIANRRPGQPLWLILIGASGSGKSSYLEVIKGNEIISRDSLKVHTLISDYRVAKEDISLLPQLHQKTLILTDLSSILTLPADQQETIWGQLREAYKGRFEYHSGVRHVSFECRFGLIAAAVPLLNIERELLRSLGERFFYFHIKYGEYDRQKAGNNIKAMWDKENRRYNILSNASRNFLDNFKVDNSINLEAEEKNWVVSICDLVSLLRSSVYRDRYRRWILERPSIEVHSRLSMQFLKFTWALKQLGIMDFKKVIMKLAFSSVPSLRLSVISRCAQLGSITQKELSSHTGLPHQRISEIFQELIALKAIKEKAPSSQFKLSSYTLTQDIWEKLHALHLVYPLISWVEKDT